MKPVPANPARALAWALSFALTAGGTAGAQQFFGPKLYFTSFDVPAALYAGGAPDCLEDFEDGQLNCGITASSGLPDSRDCGDSVDADDGQIDGDGREGTLFHHASVLDPDFMTFTFPAPLPTSAGLVWTDGLPGSEQRFEAFGPGMVSLGQIGPFSLAGPDTCGSTFEDRFFGVRNPGGVQAIRIYDSGHVFEVDHVQYGGAVVTTAPEDAGSASWGRVKSAYAR